MKYLKIFIVVLLVLTVGLAPAAALAKKNSGDGEAEASPFRVVWDTVWRFINFFILAFVIYKYGRKPLVDFLTKHSKEVGETIEENESKLAAARAEFEETQKQLDKLADTVREVEEYMKSEAERAKQRILDDAKLQAEKIVEDAHEKAQSQARHVFRDVKSELVEQAVTEAEKLIRGNIKDEDEDRLINEYMEGLQQAV